MKSNMANVWLLGIVVTFILLFSAYIIITVNYSTSFRLKNEVLDIIEKNRGVTNYYKGNSRKAFTIGDETRSLVPTGNVGALQIINLYLLGNAYNATGNCPSEEYRYGVSELETESIVDLVELNSSTESQKFHYCISKYMTGIPGPYNSSYYKVRLFFKFEFPVLQDFFSIKVEGMTNEIYKPVDDIEPEHATYFIYSN